MIFNLSKNIFLQIILGILIFLLIFGLFFKGTITFSYIILFLFLIILLNPNNLNKNDIYKFFLEFKIPFLIFLLFLIWIIIQPLFLNEVYYFTSTEIKGQLIVPLLFFFSGFLLVISKFKFLSYRSIFNIIFYSGFLHVLIVVIMAFFEYIKLCYFPIRKNYLLEVNEISYFTNLIYALFLAEIYNRLKKNNKLLSFNNNLIPIFLFIFIFSVYLQGMRWGMVTFCITSTFFAFIAVSQLKFSNKKKLAILIFFFSLLIGVFIMNIKSDKRWNSLIETVQIVINDKSLYWIDKNKYPCPKLSTGECVDLSNYLRLKQFLEGLVLIKEYPIGNGYSRHSYQNLINKIYNSDEESFNFPHSGMINLFVGVGIIGMILYVTFLIYLIFRLSRMEYSYPKIFTIFFIIAFHSRSFVDMTFMNHNLKMYFFILGIGLVSSMLENEKNNEIKTNQSK
jgi:hypothetical protein